MPTTAFYTSIFTVEGRAPEQNRYLDMLLLWLSQIIKGNLVTSDDLISCIMDDVSFQHMQRMPFLSRLVRRIPCPMRWITYPQPKTLQEGLAMRFKIPLTYTQDILMYTDVDVVPLAPYSRITDTMAPNTIYVHKEGQLKLSPYYNHSFPKNILDAYPTGAAGFSSGKFAIYGKQLATYFLGAVRYLILQSPTYKEEVTTDQPYFNQALYTYLLSLPTPYKVDTKHFAPSTLSSNGHNLTSTTVLVDCMGDETGNGPLHWNKVIQFYTLLFTGGI